MQIHRRVPGVSGQGGSMVVPLPPPLQIVHAQPMGEQENSAAGLRDRRSQSLPVQLERLSVPAQPHEEPSAGSGWPLDGRPGHRSAPRARLRAGGEERHVIDFRSELRERRIDSAADQARDARTSWYTSPVMPRVRSCVGVPRTPGTRAIVWCMVSTRSVTPIVASTASRLYPRRSDRRRTWGVRGIAASLQPALPEDKLSYNGSRKQNEEGI